MLDKMDPEAFDEVMAMVHNMNIANEDKVTKKIKAEWFWRKEIANDTLCTDFIYFIVFFIDCSHF